MGKPFDLRPHTLYDPIVLEGIAGINTMLSDSLPGCITGGMAAQSYMSRSDHRKTVDIDFLTLCGGISHGGFKEICQPLSSYLEKLGYSVDFRKKGFTYEVFADNIVDALLFQHHRRTSSNYERQKNSLEREVENAHDREANGIEFKALSPEDIIIHKVSRALIFSSKHHLKIPYLSSKDSLKNQADSVRQDVLSRLLSVAPKEVAKLRLFYDCLDVKSILSSVDIDESYFRESAKDWDKNEIVSLKSILHCFDRLSN